MPDTSAATSRQYALAFHDLAVSAGSTAVQTIETVRTEFKGPLTLHLVCDAPLSANPDLTSLLKSETASGNLEVVFHGTRHTCPEGTWPGLLWFHKNQAEYLTDSEELRKQTATSLEELRTALGMNVGICPACWLASGENRKLFKSLKPLYVESMFFLNTEKGHCFSPLISLGSPEEGELVLLRLQARFFRFLSLALPDARTRITVHPCDLTNGSFRFLLDQAAALEAGGYTPVLQKMLL